MMHLTTPTLGLLLLVAPSISAAAEAPDFGKAGRAYLQQHCLKCHGGAKPKAGLSLEPFRDSSSLVKQRKTWDTVLTRIAKGEMPPKGQPQPSIAEAVAFTDLVKAVFDHADRNAKPDPGRVTMRRLNRVEYRNTVRDLMGVQFDPTADFPSDDIGHGFDNIGDVLTLSPALMERYLAAAESIVSQAIMPDPPPVIKRRLASIYTEPASGESAKLAVNGFRPMSTDGKQFIELGPINTPYNWESDSDYIFRTRVYAESGNGKPLKVTLLLHGNGLPNPSPDAELNTLLGNVQRPARILKTFLVAANKREDAVILEVHVPAAPNRHRMMIAIDKPAAGGPHSKLWVEYLALDGPLDPRPASHRQLLAVTPGKPQAEQSREVLSRFLRRTFRQPVTPDELSRSIRLVDLALAEGDKWESAIQFAMQAALCSPKFLFRMELDNQPRSPQVRTLDEFQLASRLSYFLWSTMPDDTLLDLAEKKQLTANLDTQVRRMLADPRASSLVQNFVMQWLQVKRIEFISPDGQLFPTFNVKLREAMLRETELFVESILREDRSVLDLIDADFTFLNEPLAQHYGIADTNGNTIGQKPQTPRGRQIKGQQFQRVSLQDRTRGGLLTQASVLTVTSNPTRTSPVKRGRWVLEQILGAPPPPPPADVPELSEEKQVVSTASLRQRMEAHRRNPACANCHAKMDPIGFALENFNAVGAFRTTDGDFDVDATGEFSDGTKFSGPAELKTIVMQRKEEFTRCLIEKMLTYALGRGIEFYDRPTVEKIVQSLPAQQYKFSALVAQIVKCDAFRQRRGE
ncbi:MAG: DUF1592 domain-containing protein [Planctomycetota bacterium]|nr:DUF1592 domain-containing protein [Planctomycetota bacterium]